jgi:hypothetical protein
MMRGWSGGRLHPYDADPDGWTLSSSEITLATRRYSSIWFYLFSLFFGISFCGAVVGECRFGILFL